jgi:parallel beta-helix repeat protein
MIQEALTRVALGAALLASLPAAARALTYEVGPGKPYANVGDVPWEALNAGDTVLIHYRTAPYKEKFVLSRVGTQSQPITVRGVPGPNGERPVLDGDGATTRAQLDYYSRDRGVIKIGGSSVPFADGTSVMPKWLVIENLEIRGARPPNTYTAPNGNLESYSKPASSIYLEFGENVTVRNCDLHDNGNGFFAYSSNTIATRNLLLEGNHIHDNGNAGSNFEHNVYVEAIGVTYQYNHFGPPLPGAGGNNIKDRSAGLVVRYNWVEGSNRQFDLVDAEDSSLVRAQPSYRFAHVYGNVVIEHPNSGNNDIVFYGGDSGVPQNYRKGTLYFYNNTVVSDRTNATRLFRMATNAESIDARNNVAYVTAAGGNLKVLDDYGRLKLTQNWFKTGWTPFNVGNPHGRIVNNGTLTGSAPGFVSLAGQDYHLVASSPCIDEGAPLSPKVLPLHNVVREYVKHQLSAPRAHNGPFDIGAYEF